MGSRHLSIRDYKRRSTTSVAIARLDFHEIIGPSIVVMVAYFQFQGITSRLATENLIEINAR